MSEPVDVVAEAIEYVDKWLTPHATTLKSFELANADKHLLSLRGEVERLQALPQKVKELAEKWNTHDRWWEDKETLDTHRDELLALLKPQTGDK